MSFVLPPHFDKINICDKIIIETRNRLTAPGKEAFILTSLV